MSRANDLPAEKLMAYLDGEMPRREAREFERLLDAHPEWREEVEEMASIVDASGKLRMRLAPQIWDNYWEEIDSRLKRHIGWALVGAGGAILFLWGFFKVLFFAENLFVQLGMILVGIGLLVLFFAVLRGRFLEWNKDRYRRIRR